MSELLPNQNTVNNKYDKVLFCRKCGQKLIDNSLYCHDCGTLIIYGSETEHNDVAADIVEKKSEKQ